MIGTIPHATTKCDQCEACSALVIGGATPPLLFLCIAIAVGLWYLWIDHKGGKK